ncbi:hypothetical protein [Paenibacillus oceani]|uniref:Uncharacterized protein n=1 Tax=Paenibacillus oceani TaxID=2772510 RepID=A0A927CHL6_9BACL|nr:hypothetical protein [Paenibacillus oceani]MBD2866361.1 hypothetical protein [Paenibacillus oceani]
MKLRMNERQLDGYLYALDLCASRVAPESEPELGDRIEEVKWILQRIYKQPAPEEEAGI